MEDLTSNGGERLLTLMVYLTAPEDGGNTVFPQIGLSVTPEVGTREKQKRNILTDNINLKKGAALIWFNIKADGVFDTRSCHLGEGIVA